MGYFCNAYSLIKGLYEADYWDNWDSRDNQLEGAALVAPLSVLFWEDE